ncbi:MAG TPA: xanthine dehydrogenase [Clostridiaceae bacterium]|nr:xanthine dehydrogenase [Clostridiaceae bacterium]
MNHLIELYGRLYKRIRQNGSPVLVTHLDPKKDCVSQLSFDDSVSHAEFAAQWNAIYPEITALDASAWKDALEHCQGTGLPAKLPKNSKKRDAQWIVEWFSPQRQLYIFGGGTVAEKLANYAHDCGFRVTVCDDRIGFANRQRFPQIDNVICAPFNEILQSVSIQPRDFVVIVTRGHQYDTECLRHVLPIQPAYFGMIGSRSRVKATRELMIEEGFTAAQLARLSSPIGLNIGGITPAEIAISIVSQLVCVKRLGQTEAAAHNVKIKKDDSDLDINLFKLLADPNQAGLDCALMTIISTKGSTPRGAGARMLIFPDGRTIGSIGGGCAEGDSIVQARAMLADGSSNYEILAVDMTGDVAADEGMVCGGTADILIQVLRT